MAKTPLSRKLAKELIQNAESQLNTLQAQGLKLENTEKLLKITKEAYNSRRLEETIDNLNELGTKLNELKKFSTKFSEVALDCHKRLKQASSMGMDSSQLNEQLEYAHNLFDNEEFNQAINTASDCQKRLIDGQFLYITDKIKEIYDQLKELPKNIINSQDIQQRFNDADAAIKNNDFVLAWTITNQLTEICNKIASPYLTKVQELAKDKIIEFQDEIENSKDKGVDLSDAKEIFSKMVDRTKKANRISEFKEIIDYTTAGKHALERAVRRKERLETQMASVREKLDPILVDIEDLKNHCAIPNSVEKLIKNSHDDLTQNNFDSAHKNIEQCQQKLDKLRRGSEPKIELKFVSEVLKSDFWNRTKLSVSNNGLASADNINIRFTGPVESRRIPVIEILKYNSTETLEIGLRPEGAGSLPIDVDINYIRSWDGKEYHEHQEIWLEVIPSGQLISSTVPVAPYVPSKPPKPIPDKGISEWTNCLYCENIIKKAQPIFKCQCGSIYHLECVENLDICVKCGSDIRQKINTSSQTEKSN